MGLKGKYHTELPYDPAILQLGICLKKSRIRKDTDTQMCTAAIFTIAKTWEQPKSPSTDEWVKKWYTYTMEYYSAMGKKWNNVICSNIDGSRDNFSWLYLSPFPQNHTLSHPPIIFQFLPVLLHQTIPDLHGRKEETLLCILAVSWDVHDLSHHQFTCLSAPWDRLSWG